MADSKEVSLQAQLLVWKFYFHFIDSTVLRAAVELGLADIINEQSDGMPVSLDSIALGLNHPPSDLSALARVMRFLAHKHIFSEESDPHLGETFYGPTPTSRWLLQGDHKLSLAHNISMGGTLPWNKLSEAVMHGGTQSKGTSDHSELNKVYDAAMAASADMVLEALLAVYSDRLAELGTLVDVGGGAGVALSKITKLCPNLRGINFDQSDVVAAAPEIPNVVHVGGSMFEDDIPTADAVLLKWILHNFGDEDCLKVLKSCRKAIPATGKVIIVEVVLDPEDHSPVGDAGLAMDMVMLTVSAGGLERTEEDWRWLLKQGGFPRLNIIKIPAIVSVIEAYPS